MNDVDFNEEVVYALWSVYTRHTRHEVALPYVAWAQVNGF